MTNTIHMPTVEFLREIAQQANGSNYKLGKLMKQVAITLGDMLAHQSDPECLEVFLSHVREGYENVT